MLDFGRRMGFDSLFFSEFINPRTNTELRDRLMIGSIPNIPGIYRSDMLKPTGLSKSKQYHRILDGDSSILDYRGLVTYEEYIGDNDRGYLDAILVSHAHMDHVGDIEFVHPDIPVHCTTVTKALIESIDDVTTFKTCALLSSKREISETKSGMFPGAPKISKKSKIFRGCITEDSRVGDVDVRMIDVDHSVPGACSFLLKAHEHTILYTGDIRFHGSSPISKEEYIRAIGEEVDILICEGTRVNSDKMITEDMVRESITEDIKATKGLVFVDFSWKDTTRFETVRRAAVDNDRIFVIDARLAYLLDTLGEYPGDDSVKVFLRRNGSAIYSPADYGSSKHELGFSVDKENLDMSHYESGVTAVDIMEDPGRYVLMLSYFQFNQLFDFAGDDGRIPDSYFIKAQCEPFSDDMELDEERMINWLEKFGIDFEEDKEGTGSPGENHRCISRSHVSGHASRPELKELISLMKPRVLIPVHTHCPEEFTKIAKEIEEETGTSIDVRILPEGVRCEF